MGRETQHVAVLFLMVGLPGAGKTARAKKLAAEHPALRLSPDAWMIPLFGEPGGGGRKRDVLAIIEADMDSWRSQFDVPDTAELDGGELAGPPPPWPTWFDWAAERWPSLADG